MLLPLRVLTPDGAHQDVRVELADDSTVGELADALADGLEGWREGESSILTRWPDHGPMAAPSRHRRVLEHGPPAGASVVLVTPPPTDGAAALASPVRLVDAAGGSRTLDYGHTDLGDVVVVVGQRVEAHDRRGDARRNGAALLGTTHLHDGDVLRAGRRWWTVHVDGPLAPPAAGGPWREVTRRAPEPDPTAPTRVELPTPPDAVRLPGFPVLSATVPLLMGAALWMATGSLASALFVLFSFVFVLASGLEARREARAEDRFRVQEFHAAVHESVDTLAAAATLQRLRHERCTPPLDELVDRARNRPEQLWQRRRTDGDLMVVRLGLARRPLEVELVGPAGGRRALREHLEHTLRDVVELEDVVAVDLRHAGGLAVLGGDAAVELARAVTMQLACLIGPDDLGVEIVSGPGRSPRWRWAGWLPHTLPAASRRCTLVVADGVDAAQAAEAVARVRDGGVEPVLLWLGQDAGAVPEGIDAAVRVGFGPGEHDASLRRDRTAALVREVRLEGSGPDDAEPLARLLAALTPVVQASVAQGGVGPTLAPPDRVQLGEVLTSPELLQRARTLATHWDAAADAATGAARRLHVPLGRAAGGGTGVVGIDLVADGPHVLVAGTTGAGKSELLRSLVLGAALEQGPDRVHFLLVDYKGGAAFGALVELPHTVGLITDLTPALAERALVSLRAELRRREHLLADEGRSEWSGPALVVVVDEFATLSRELPQFVEGVVDLAQRGRSLGVHLVLATQRPAGVVTDAIRANTSVRIALRVTDAEDSHDVVGDDAASRLPRSAAGRAVVRIDGGPVVHFQTAFSGAPPRSAPRVSVRPWSAGPAPAPAPVGAVMAQRQVELDLGVRTARRAAELRGLCPPRRPWVDALPERLDWSTMSAAPPEHGHDGHHGVPIGLVDRPEQQRRAPLVVDLHRDGGLVVLGTGGSGRSHALAALVCALGSSGERWMVHVLDGDGSLAGLSDEPVVGDVVGLHDTERVGRLLRSWQRALDRRREQAETGTDGDRRLLVLDGYAAFEERYDRMDRGVLVEVLHRVARDGRAVGLHVALSAARPGEVPSPLANCLGARLQLRCTTADDALMAGLGPTAADPELPPGRCWVSGHTAQIADWRSAPARTGAPPVDGLVPKLPARLRLDDVPASEEIGHDEQLAVGVDADLLQPVGLDLSRHALVVGPPRSGRSTTLATLVTSHRRRLRSGLALVARTVDEVDQAVAQVLDAGAEGRPCLLAIDDVTDLLDGNHGDLVERRLHDLLERAEQQQVRLVLAGDVDTLLRCYHDAVTRVRAGRTGLLLDVDPDLHGDLLHTTIERRSDLPRRAGRGWCVQDGAARPVQVAVAATR